MGFTNGRNPLCLMELTKRGIKRKCFRQCLIAFFNGYMFIFIHIHIHLDDNPNSKQKHSYKCSLKTQSFRNLHGRRFLGTNHAVISRFLVKKMDLQVKGQISASFKKKPSKFLHRLFWEIFFLAKNNLLPNSQL